MCVQLIWKWANPSNFHSPILLESGKTNVEEDEEAFRRKFLGINVAYQFQTYITFLLDPTSHMWMHIIYVIITITEHFPTKDLRKWWKFSFPPRLSAYMCLVDGVKDEMKICTDNCKTFSGLIPMSTCSIICFHHRHNHRSCVIYFLS